MKLILAVQFAALALGVVHSAKISASKQTSLHHLRKELSLLETSAQQVDELAALETPSQPSATDFESRVEEHARAIIEPTEIARDVQALEEQFKNQLLNRAQVEKDKAEEISSLKDAAEMKYATDKNALEQAEQAVKDAQEEFKQAKLDTEHRKQIVADKHDMVLELRRKGDEHNRELQAFRAEVQTETNELNFLRQQFQTRREQEVTARKNINELEKSLETVRHQRVMKLEELRRRFQEEEDSRIMTTMRQAETRSDQLREDISDAGARLNTLESQIIAEQERAIKPLEDEYGRRVVALDTEFSRESGRINVDKDRVNAEKAAEVKRLEEIMNNTLGAIKGADARIIAIDQEILMRQNRLNAGSAAAAAASAINAAPQVAFLELSQAPGSNEVLDDATAIKSLQEEKTYLVDKRSKDQGIYAETKNNIDSYERSAETRVRDMDAQIRALTARIVDAKAKESALLTENKTSLTDKFAKQLEFARNAASLDIDAKQKTIDKIQGALKDDVQRIQKETEPKIQQEGALLIRQNEEDDRKIADGRRAVDEARAGLDRARDDALKKEKVVQEKEVELRTLEFDDWNAKISARENEELEAKKAVDEALKAESDANNSIVRATQVTREIEKTLERDMEAVRLYKSQMKAILRAAKEIERSPLPNFDPEVRARRVEQAQKEAEAKAQAAKYKNDEEARILALSEQAKLQEMVAKQEQFLAARPMNA